MCSNCKESVCGGRGAIAYENFNNNGCGCGNSVNYANDYSNDCGCGNANSSNNGCGCANNCGGIIGSLAKGFACTTNRIARGLDRSLSSCGGFGNHGCGCGGNGCGC